MDRQRWDRKYAGIEFEPALPPGPFVAADLPGLRILRAGRVRRPVEQDSVPAIAIVTLVRAERPGPDTG